MKTIKTESLTYNLAGQLDWRSQRQVNCAALGNDFARHHYTHLARHARGLVRAVGGSIRDGFYNAIGF